MERLTYDFALGGNHCWQVKGADNLECREVCERQGDAGCKTCPIAKAFDRLAAYEETGLEPEEIELPAKQRDLYVDACGELPLKRIRELAQADREGRCVVSPASIGDTVYHYENAERAYMKVVAELEQVKRERDAAVSWAQKYTESIDMPCVACKHNTGDYVCTAICGNCGPMGAESCKWEFDFSGELKED